MSRRRTGTTRIDTHVVDEWDVTEPGFHFDDGHAFYPPTDQKIDVRWDSREEAWELSWRVASAEYRIVLHPDVAAAIVSALK